MNKNNRLNTICEFYNKTYEYLAPQINIIFNESQLKVYLSLNVITFAIYDDALNIDDDPTFKDEVRRLNNAFGIGIIKLNADDVFESEILFPAKINQEIDWDTVNRLANENSDFNNFLKLITEDCKLGKVKSQYDEVLNLEKLAKHIKDKGISATDK